MNQYEKMQFQLSLKKINPFKSLTKTKNSYRFGGYCPGEPGEFIVPCDVISKFPPHTLIKNKIRTENTTQ